MKPSQVTEMKALTDKYEKDAGTLATFKALESKSGDLQKVGPGEAAFRDGKPFAYNPGPDKTAGKRSPEAAKADQSLGQFMKQNPTGLSLLQRQQEEALISALWASSPGFF